MAKRKSMKWTNRERAAFVKYRNSVLSEYRIPLSERVMRAGYVIREELVAMGGDDIITRAAYTARGEYIGEPKWAAQLAKRSIVPELRTTTSQVCSIGYCAREKKWYGWSHRAIFGFKIGSRVGKGSSVSDYVSVGFVAKTMADAKYLAEMFAESVS